MSALASLGQLKVRAVLLLTAMFAAGVVAGAGGMLGFGPVRNGPWRGGPYSELGLSPEQQVRMREILDRHRPELDAVVRESMPRVQPILEAIDKEMETVLTAEQTRRFRELKALRPRLPLPGMMPIDAPPPPLH